MEQSIFPRSLWTNDSKFLHHHVADFFTSVQVTQDIPAGTSFGPCVLHNTFYDTIAFIALKSSDKRNKSYAFRVSNLAFTAYSNMHALTFIFLLLDFYCRLQNLPRFTETVLSCK